MIKILFTSEQLLLSFMYPMSSKYDFEFHKDYDGIWDCFVCEDYLFCLNTHLSHDDVHKYDVIVDNYIWFWEENNVNRHTPIDEFIHQGKKVFIVDMETDSVPSHNFDYFKREVESCENVYFINSRNYCKDINNSIHNLQYLQLFHAIFYSYDLPHLHPQLPTICTKNQPYDLIGYIGLEETNKQGDERSTIINRIETETDKIVYRCESFKNDRKKIQKISENIAPSLHGLGQLTYFSQFESMCAKVKLRFETLVSVGYMLDELNFLTEKTNECFLSSQPYFLFIRETQRVYLKNIGFKLPGPNNSKDYIDYVIDVCKNDLDTWIDENQHTFEHNKRLFYNMMFDYNLPHITFFEKNVTT